MFLACAAPCGYALIDREVYLPRSWTANPDRCAAAGVLDTVTFATKITLGRRMLTRALDAGVPAGTGCVLAVAKSHRVTVPLGRLRADQLAAGLTKWTKILSVRGSVPLLVRSRRFGRGEETPVPERSWESDYTDYVTTRMARLRAVAFALCGDWHSADDLCA